MELTIIQSFLSSTLHTLEMTHRVSQWFLSISHNQLLSRLDQSSVDSLPQLETLTVNNNPNLIYFHPGAISKVPRLVVLDLTQNSLYSPF